MTAWWTLASAVAISAAATYGARALAPALGLVSKPNPLVAQHVRPVACLGGLGVATGMCLALLLAAPEEFRARTALLVPALLYLVFGIIDDRRPLNPLIKLAGQVLIGLLAVGLGAFAPLTGHRVVDGAIALSWIVVLVNAFNVLDVCDGLLGGIAALFFGAIAVAAPPVRIPAAAAAGACLGFLAFNRPRATIFLGDGGSHFLGFLAAALGLTPRTPRMDGRELVALLLALALPLFEVAFLVYARTARGLPWWRGSKDHFALRLQAAGWTPWRTIGFAWASAGTLAALGLALRGLPAAAAWAAAAFVVLIGFAAARWLTLRTEPAIPHR